MSANLIYDALKEEFELCLNEGLINTETVSILLEPDSYTALLASGLFSGGERLDIKTPSLCFTFGRHKVIVSPEMAADKVALH
jgi:hypothetical protein